MKLNQLFMPSFEGARINIVANSDNHGNITTLPAFYNTIKTNEKDIFQKADEDSTLNLYINAGDFFINGAKSGYRSQTNATNMDVQADFLQLLIKKIEKVANTRQFKKEVAAEKAKGNPNFNEESYAIKKPSHFAAIYTPGNHCYDAGDEVLYKTLGKISGLTTVMTNINPDSQALKDCRFDERDSKFCTSKEFTINDDKYDFKKHHLMVLGVTIPSMDFYNPGLVAKDTFVEGTDKKDANMTQADIQKTIDAIRVKVDDFKERYPDGIIILSSHMGTRLSKMVRDEIPEINEILDGHKHDVATSQKGKCNVSSLGQDNNIVKSISLQIDDRGEIERESYVYDVGQYKLEEGTTNSLKRMLEGGFSTRCHDRQCYAEEFKEIVRLTGEDGTPVSFDYGTSIRFSNSRLANFLTSALKKSLTDIEGYEDVDIVGVQSSIIRGGFKDSASNFELMQIFNGVSEKLSAVRVGAISGEMLASAVIENVKGNLKAPDRNTLIHWSDVQVDRNGINLALQNNPKTTDSELSQFVKVRDKYGKFAPIDMKKQYKVALADKYLEKTDIVMPQRMKPYFKIDKSDTSITYHSLLMKYLKDDSNPVVTPDTPRKCSPSEYILDYTDDYGNIRRIFLNRNLINEMRVITGDEEVDVKKK